jgi:hypothetical protein
MQAMFWQQGGTSHLQCRLSADAASHRSATASPGRKEHVTVECVTFWFKAAVRPLFWNSNAGKR